tara:strand:- start:3253 stop:3609 length:357 start_codon:yes stop_codon:yes gene_type:complete
MMIGTEKKIEIADEYVRIMSMVVPQGKIGLEFIGDAERDEEVNAKNHLVNIAKKFKLHRKVKATQCGIIVSFDKSIDDFSNLNLRIDLDTSTIQGHIRRMIILATLFIILVFLFMRMH